MRKEKQQTHSVDFLFTMITFLVYAASMLALVYMGAAVYRRVTAQMDTHDTWRTAQAYVREKVRQNDKSGALSAEIVDGCPALAIREEIDGEIYATYVYAYDGALRELTMPEGRDIPLKGGMEITRLAEFEIEEQETGCFTAAVTDAEGVRREFLLHSHSVD